MYLNNKKVSFLVSLLMCCISAISYGQGNIKPDLVSTVDFKATKQTKALYANLKKISTRHVLFGHQDDLAYGVMWKDWHKN